MPTDPTHEMPAAPEWPREFELCCETLQACEAAAAGGADRIELCTALDVGGVTPPLSVLRAALELTTLPIHVLIRPRGGGFQYTAAEFSLLLQQVEDAVHHGASGVVTGVLDEDMRVDLERMRDVMHAANGKPITFHRAFDLTPDLPVALEEIIGLGCARVLTSGGAADVISGLAMLQKLTAQAAGRIRVAAGGGVRVANAALLLETPELDLHASLRTFDGTEPSHPLEGEFGSGYVVRMKDVRAITDLVHNGDAR